uniref:Elongator complex protein 1 n=1 Tax=Timema cristinae TaxID=61476 RepID=A0A7R9CEW9_TIMCR|nr:unnamed protein product [Timema cristinae]
MKNLALFKFQNVDIDCSEIVNLFCIDSQFGDIYIYGEGYVFKITHITQKVTRECNLLDYYEASDIPSLVNINCNPVAENICLAFENGDVLTLEHRTNIIVCVGFVDSGLKSLCWSPDQEVVCMVTGRDTVIIMTGTFDPITEVDLHQDSFGEKQFITVGWGKKETQFHGSEGKAARFVTQDVNNPNSNKDDGIALISWRGDGLLFAVSVVSKENVRYIRIFNREGVLQYTSEKLSGLESVLAWRPSGNLLATTQQLPNKYIVAFFEKNGLRHGEFSLPFSSSERKVLQLLWNTESTILTVHCENVASSDTSLYFYTVNNYHWYLKQVLDFSKDQKICCVEWDIESKNRLHVICEGGHYFCYDWTWVTNHSYGNATSNGAFVAVIDGDEILLTSFRGNVTPPPMSDQKVKLLAAINAVMFGFDDNSACAVLADGRLVALVQDKVGGPHQVQWVCEVVSECTEILHHWVWLFADTFVCCSGTHVMLLVRDPQQEKLILRSKAPLDSCLVSIVRTADPLKVLLQMSDGKLFVYDTAQNKVSLYNFNLSECCTKLNILRVEETEFVFGLSDRNRFYINTKEIANNVTSYTLHSEFILLTTLQHTLLCSRLDLDGIESLASDHNLGTSRRIERGARLVIAVPCDTRVILQMPRGNLECIQPRPLLLHLAATYLDSREYRRAFELFRKQRINLNLLYDHNPEVFSSNTGHFVRSVKDPTWLSLFLSELQEMDMTQTMYAGFYAKKSEDKSLTKNKVHSVCEVVRTAILALDDSETYLLPVITSHVRQQSLAAALDVIKTVREQEDKAGGRKPLVSSGEALRYLLYLVDVNELYDVALGMYDFELVTMVAAKSQKDPKEYLPFLNQLRKMEPHYQRYCIDKHLKRFESALHNIASCLGNNQYLEECLTLIRDHKLYTQALLLFDRSSPAYGRVSVLYAEHLLDSRRPYEAALMFQRGGDLSRALQCYQAAGDWRQALTLANTMQYSESQVHELCRLLVERLAEQHQYGEAAQVLSQLVGDLEESVAMLVRGHMWPQATWSALSGKRSDLIETHIKPGLSDHLELLTSQLATAREQFGMYKARLAVVRSTQQLHFEDKEGDTIPADSDLFSDTSSVMTSTIASSRSRLSEMRETVKEEPVQGRIEKSRLRWYSHVSLLSGGGVDTKETDTLAQSLSVSTSRSHRSSKNRRKQEHEVRCLCTELLRFHRDKEAASLQRDLVNVLKNMQGSLAEIWTPELASSGPHLNVFGPEATVNSITAKFASSGNLNTSHTLLEPRLRIAPVISSDTTWQMEILKAS